MIESRIFKEEHRDASSRARTGEIRLPHGIVQTPAFMPVGTNATVKAMPPEDLQAMGFKIILANTYHLYLRPGHELIRAAGGLHGFSGWNGNFLMPQSASTLSVGLYEGLQRYPFNNPVKGGLSWSGEGRGCNTLSGWFAVDKVSYSGTTLQSLDLRFQQNCEGGVAALRGKLHWNK